MGRIVHSGYLRKQGFTVKNWRRRWFTLDNSDQLKYYRDQEDKKEAGCIDMHECSSIYAASKCKCQWEPLADLRFCFGLVTKKRTYFIVAENAEEFLGWMTALKKAARIGFAVPVEDDSVTAIASAPPPALPSPFERAATIAGAAKKPTARPRMLTSAAPTAKPRPVSMDLSYAAAVNSKKAKEEDKKKAPQPLARPALSNGHSPFEFSFADLRAAAVEHKEEEEGRAKAGSNGTDNGAATAANVTAGEEDGDVDENEEEEEEEEEEMDDEDIRKVKAKAARSDSFDQEIELLRLTLQGGAAPMPTHREESEAEAEKAALVAAIMALAKK